MKTPYSHGRNYGERESGMWVHFAGAGILLGLWALVAVGQHYGVIWDGSDCAGWLGFPCASAR